MTSIAAPPADPTAVTGRRIAGWLIDLIIFLALATAIVAASGAIDTQTVTYDSSFQAERACEAFNESGNQGFCFYSGDEVFFIDANANFWGIVLIHFLAYSVIQGATGASLGKLAVGLRVVSEDGTQAGMGKSFARTFLWVGDGIICMTPILGGILMLSTKGHRRLGDMVAGTYVVARESVGIPISISPATAPTAGAWQQPPAGGPVPPPAAQPTWAPPAQPGATPAPAGGDDGPTWDEARNTYIQYDRAQNQWMQWDAASGQWQPIAQ